MKAFHRETGSLSSPNLLSRQSRGPSLDTAAKHFLVFACLLIAATTVSAQGGPMENSKSLRYDFFPAALSCPITSGMGKVGGRVFQNGKFVTYPFKPYLICNGIDILEFPFTFAKCDAYCPIPRSESRTPASLEKLEVQLRDVSKSNNRVVTISVCAQNHVGNTECASITKVPPVNLNVPYQVMTIGGSDLDPIRKLSIAHSLYLHFHQKSGLGAQPMDFVNWAVYWQ